MKRILVTGGLGFIGRHLVDRLLIDGDDRVIVVDKEQDSRERQPNLLVYDRTSIEEYSRAVFDRSQRRRLQRPDDLDIPFDEIYHLASHVGPVGVIEHGGKIVLRTVADTYAMITLAQRDRAKLCFVSTSEVYGRGTGQCREDDHKIITAQTSARLEYATAKLACEVAIANLVERNSLDARIIRPFNVVGPGQRAAGGFVLPRFVQQALDGVPLTVYGTGEAQRAFTHVADVVDGIIRAMRRGKPGQAYNIGNLANRTNIRDLALRVLRFTQSTSPLQYVDPKYLHGPLFAEACDKYPDPKLANQELDWWPEHDLDKVIMDTIEWFRTHHGTLL